jgi:hypothetical protein
MIGVEGKVVSEMCSLVGTVVTVVTASAALASAGRHITLYLCFRYSV